MLLEKRKKFGEIIIIILLINIFMLAYTTNAFSYCPTAFSVIEATDTSYIYGYVSREFGSNESISMSFSGNIPIMWNASSLIPFVFNVHATDNTVRANAQFHLSIYASFMNFAKESIYEKSSIVFNRFNNGYTNFDQLITDVRWEMFPQVTGISKGSYWNGVVYLKGRIAYGEETIVDFSNSLQIIYGYDYTLPKYNPLPFQIPVSLFGGIVILVFIVGTYIGIQRRKRVI